MRFKQKRKGCSQSEKEVEKEIQENRGIKKLEVTETEENRRENKDRYRIRRE